MIKNSSENYTAYQGLTDEEVRQRLLKHGLNELPELKSRNFLAVSIEIFTEPMFLLLLSCCVLYLILGDLQEALTLSVFVLVIIGITLFQSWKTEKTLAALKDLSSPKSLVIRNGQESYIASRDLVLDDILILNEGDKVSADAIVLDAVNLMADEASLTGESMPVRKSNWDSASTLLKAGEEGGATVYSGTLITQGRAYTRVIATGSTTELGKIGSALKSISKTESRFQKEVSGIVSVMLIVAASLCLVIVAFAFLREGLIKGLLTAITFAIAMLPEEIPAVLTIFMALGAWRISQKNVLTRKMSAIETLGSVTVLCTDKTGTLTENKMLLNEVYVAGHSYKLNGEAVPEEFHSLIEFAILASREESFDPMEKAIRHLVSADLVDSEHVHGSWRFVQEYPLSKDLLAMSRAWDASGREEYSFYSKGSPEAIFDLCHLDDGETASLTAQVEKMAFQGLRVLGVAKSKSKLQYLPSIQHDIDFEFCGLLGFSDPIRSGVKEAVKECYSAGVKIVMITGDYHVTAQNIAREIGLRDVENFITGAELEKLDDVELEQRIKDLVIFSRVVPEQKLRIVQALKKNQEIVVMTGDGVNDAPALKASDVGIAMGLTGTNVARESADLILLDDNFSSIVSAIRLGRRIFANLRKAMSYILSIHIPIAGLTLLPVIFANLPTIFFPIHVAFLELIIDPTCSVVFESEPAAKDIMNRSPRGIREPILSKKKIVASVLQGVAVLLLVIAVYLFAIQAGKSDAEVRLMSFVTLLIGNFILAFLNKSWKAKSFSELLLENKSFIVVFLVVLTVFSLVLVVPTLRDLFYFS